MEWVYLTGHRPVPNESAHTSVNRNGAGKPDTKVTKEPAVVRRACADDLGQKLRRSQATPISPTALLHEAYLGISDRSAVFPTADGSSATQCA
jgi:hypothetical protein